MSVRVEKLVTEERAKRSEEPVPRPKLELSIDVSQRLPPKKIGPHAYLFGLLFVFFQGVGFYLRARLR